MKIGKWCIVLTLICLWVIPCEAKRKHYEKYYQLKWCADMKGQIEIVLPKSIRCDCLTNTHAIEVDFVNKFPEAIGQALEYSFVTGKKPGIVLIVERERDLYYYRRAVEVINTLRNKSKGTIKIDLWIIREYENELKTREGVKQDEYK